jgi:hypothetical protein
MQLCSHPPPQIRIQARCENDNKVFEGEGKSLQEKEVVGPVRVGQKLVFVSKSFCKLKEQMMGENLGSLCRMC